MHSKLPVLLAAILGFGLAACSSKPAAETGLSIPKLEPITRTLDNGLRVYALPDPNTASVSVAVWYDVGSKNDPPARSGFAHLFEHLMFKSTTNMPSETFDRLTEDVGGFNNASTWDDFTNYYETVPANHLQRVLWGEAERMGSLVVDEANFRSERAVVQEELRQRVLAAPFGRLFSLYLVQTGFDVHPYGRPGIGSIEDLDAATLDDVKAFHAAYYRPDNAILVVAGNFDPKQLDAWVDEYFAPIAAPERPIPRVTAVEPERTAPESFTVYAPNVPLPAVTISWPAPAASSADIAAWTLLDAILQRGQSSRLYQSLVYEQQLAAEVGSTFEVRADPGLYSLLAILSEGRTADEGLKALQAEVAKVRDNPVSAAELEEARNEVLAEALQARETSEGRAFELARSVILFKDPAASDRLLAQLQAVTAQDIQRVAKSLLEEARSVTIRYLPAEGGARSDTIADAATIQPTAIDIPVAEIPAYALAPEDRRVKPPAPGPAVAAKVPQASEKTLANGLRVIVANRPGLPLIAANLGIAAGGSLDPSGRAGLAALTAELTTRGTATRSATDISRQVESLGASLTASSTADASGLAAFTVANKASEVLAIMADVAQNPAFQEEELERVRQEVLDSLTVSLRQPGTVGRYVMARRLYGDGPYGKTPSPNSIAALKREDAAQFHATWWRPDNGVLVISGDVSAEEGFRLAEAAFGGWKKPEGALPAQPEASAVVDAQAPLVIDIPKIGQAAVLMGRVGPSRTAEDYFPTLVANDVLGGGYSARLNAEIRIKRGLSYGARSDLPSRRHGASIVAAAQTRNDAVPQVVELLGGEMRRLGASAIPAEELASRKAVLVGDFGRSVETVGGLAGQLSELAQFGLPLQKLQSYGRDVESVTAAQAAAAAKSYFDPGAASIVVVGDAAQFGAQLKARYPKLETITIDKLDLDSAALR
ncbi:MAG TPA: pitrilysin family protein [Steroidobacteraceae bacterium]|nr:pitrilysin family protein [Steroidobacteraceae bacterium]